MNWRDYPVGKIFKTANLLVLAVSVLLILFVVNFLAARRLTVRLDVTREKLYTLSDASRNIVGDLKDIITIKAYFSEKLPPYLANMRQDVQDMLSEYQAWSKGNLRVRFIDPGDDEEEKRRLMFEGVMPVNLQTVDRHKLEVMEAYFGMVVSYEDRKEVIPFVQPETLEYDLSSAIKKVSLPKPPTVAILTNNEDLNLEQDCRGLLMSLQKLYQVQPLTLSPGQKIPETIEVLVIADPRDFKESELFEIDQFVMRGGRLICLVDAVEIDDGTLQATIKKPNITRILDRYGMELGDDLIQDFASNAVASFSTGYMRTMVNYPFWVNLQDGLSKDSPITKKLGGLVLPWAGSVKVAENPPENVKFTVLAQTTKNAYQSKEPFDLNPFKQSSKISREDLAAYDMILLAEGEFPSAFKGEPIPVAEVENNPENPAGPSGGTTEQDRKDKGAPTSILLVANSRFIRDRSIGSTGAETNLIFLHNTIDCMTFGQDLISIRTRADAQKPLDRSITDTNKTLYKWSAILAVPILVILAGLLSIPMRYARRRYYESILVRRKQDVSRSG